MKSKKKIYLALGVSLSVLISGCAKKPTVEKPISVKPKASIDFAVDDCEHYGKLKKAVAKLIVEKEQMQKVLLQKEASRTASINKKIGKMEAEIEALRQSKKSELSLSGRSIKKTEIRSSCVGRKPPSYYIHLEKNDKYFPNKKVRIRICPYPKSKIIGFIEKNQKVKFKTCNRFGWCELEDQEGYVAGNLFTSKKTHKKVY